MLPVLVLLSNALTHLKFKMLPIALIFKMLPIVLVLLSNDPCYDTTKILKMLPIVLVLML